MQAVLSLESSLEHDGDGLTRYRLAIKNDLFRADTSAWGNDDEHLKFSAALAGFPVSSSSSLNYKFGSDGTGTCTLEFTCLDNLGHVGVWATFESTYPVDRSDRHEHASVFLRCDPAAIDEFVAELHGFVAGSPNRAQLSGLGP
ncbi:hypothetical protein DT603_12895 [Pseudoxanthomonas gei]|uniref:Uncharacterized protein n=1 Tax=Pseudoxanthomonas gei TaxID=1383030 RepID=A0ABX0ADR7_9GAMM|nr:hypothetical protein [Pseudoxanthomonas gei]